MPFVSGRDVDRRANHAVQQGGNSAGPDELCSELLARGEECLLVGDGALRHREVFDDLDHARFGGPELAHPSAAVLVGLAHARAVREEFVNPRELAPLYLRAPDAQKHWEQRA